MYPVADQVIDWTYDAAGNLLSDGTLTTTYDALNRALTATGNGQIRSYAYNGDGVLVSQTANGTTTRFTQDLASPLSQILQTQGSATTNYLYGHERLAKVSGGTRTWYGTDALGSVREKRTDTGALLSTFSYDPWGTSEGVKNSISRMGTYDNRQRRSIRRPLLHSPTSSGFQPLATLLMPQIEGTGLAWPLTSLLFGILSCAMV